MFTGIIECMATIESIESEGSNVHFTLSSPITSQLKVDQSVAHSGVCLTVVEINSDQYKVTAVAETILKTNLGKWHKGDKINLERAMKVGDRLDGHFVQGHVDTVATCTRKTELAGSWLYTFHFPAQFAALVIEKGSICINGVSLTVFNVGDNDCEVTIIPYTYANTNFYAIEEGNDVNVEFDVLGKYLIRSMQVKNNIS